MSDIVRYSGGGVARPDRRADRAVSKVEGQTKVELAQVKKDGLVALAHIQVAEKLADYSVDGLCRVHYAITDRAGGDAAFEAKLRSQIEDSLARRVSQLLRDS